MAELEYKILDVDNYFTEPPTLCRDFIGVAAELSGENLAEFLRIPA